MPSNSGSFSVSAETELLTAVLKPHLGFTILLHSPDQDGNVFALEIRFIVVTGTLTDEKAETIFLLPVVNNAKKIGTVVDLRKVNIALTTRCTSW